MKIKIDVKGEYIWLYSALSFAFQSSETRGKVLFFFSIHRSRQDPVGAGGKVGDVKQGMRGRQKTKNSKTSKPRYVER